MMKKKVKIFDIVLIVIFTVFSLVMIIPVYKVLVDSFDLKTAYGMKLFPEQFGFAGYKSIFTNPTMLTIPDFLLHNGYGNDHGIADLSTWGVCADSVEDAGAGIYCQCAVVYHDI